MPTKSVRRIALSSNTAWNLFNFRRGLIEAFLDRGDQVITLAPPDRYSSLLAELGCEVVDLQMDNQGTNPLHDLRTYSEFKRAYGKVTPNVALHYTIKPVVYGTLAARSLGIPVVNTITGLGTGFLHGGLLQVVVETLYRVSQRWPHRVFFQNPDDCTLFHSRKLVPANRTEVISGSGINLVQFETSALPDYGPITFLLIARLLWDKGIGEYVTAARHLKTIHPMIRFQLLGPIGVANRTAIHEEMINGWVEEGIIEYLGETEDVRPYIAQAHCVVLPSYREGTPRVLLEAAAMGRPVIATDVPGCREVVVDGITGFLCGVKDAESLAAAMCRFLVLDVDEMNRMGRAGREKMEREFDERVVISRYVETIDGAVSF